MLPEYRAKPAGKKPFWALQLATKEPKQGLPLPAPLRLYIGSSITEVSFRLFCVNKYKKTPPLIQRHKAEASYAAWEFDTL